MPDSVPPRPKAAVMTASRVRAKVELRVLAKCCGVAVSTIASWHARGAKSDTTPARRLIKGSLGDQRSPQMQVIDVVRPERAVGLWPKINLRAEWVRVRLNLELV